jgi:hypothetical protein
MLYKKPSFSSQIISTGASFCLSFQVVADNAAYWILLTNIFREEIRKEEEKVSQKTILLLK